MKWIALACVLLAANVAQAADAYREATAQEVSAIRSSMQKDLKDADSAKFKDVKVAAAEDGVAMCGLVNARNSYGAYAGFSYFTGVMLAKGTQNPSAVVFGVDSKPGGPAEETCKSSGCCN